MKPALRSAGERDLGEPLVRSEYDLTRQDFNRIAAMIKADTGIHLPESKATLVYSRLAKRLRALKFESFKDYCELTNSPEGAAERAELLSALTTNVTRFFREGHHFEHLEERALPPLVARARKGGRVRLWSAACSTGQEPYSIALSILAVDPKAHELDIRVLATDVDPQVVAFGRQGVYAQSAVADVPPQHRQRFFSRKAGGEGASFMVADELKTLVAFRVLNLHGAWPMKGLFSVIFCRNAVIYFEEDAQRAVWSKFASQMEPSGWLYIGHSERVTGPASASFSTNGVTTYQFTGRRAG